MAKAVKTPKTNAMRELESAGISYVLHTYEDDGDESVGLGVAISEQLGEEPGQGFKTLVCVTPSNDYVVCCIPVADELDLKSAARAAGEKSLAMMHVKDLLAATGYVRGGCSPVGMKKRYRTLIDETCVLWDTWSTRLDYAFGYLMPVFMLYVIWDRLPKIEKYFLGKPSQNKGGLLAAGTTFLFGGMAVCGFAGFMLFSVVYSIARGTTVPLFGMAFCFAFAFYGFAYLAVSKNLERVDIPLSY